MEAVLQAVRADALGAPLADGFQPWEEADGQAAVFSHQNLLGVATQVLQRPGELLALQVQTNASHREFSLAFNCEATTRGSACDA